MFRDQLGRFYAAGRLERLDLLEHYGFSSRWAPGVRRRVEQVYAQSHPGGDGAGPVLQFPGGRQVESVCQFYEHHLARLQGHATDACFVSYVHGDLNGANIVIDAQDNVWIIDFFHTDRGHVLKDLIKLENDLLYIFTPVEDGAQLEQALTLSDALVAAEDLTAPLADLRLEHPALQRAHDTVRILRSFYPDLIGHDRDALQLLVAQLRYAVHTLGFDEASPLQKCWALYMASLLGE